MAAVNKHHSNLSKANPHNKAGKAAPAAVGEDVENIDFDNFKGIYFGEEAKKYFDPHTGAHFEYFDFCKRLSRLKEHRAILDVELGIVPAASTLLMTDEQQLSPSAALNNQ